MKKLSASFLVICGLILLFNACTKPNDETCNTKPFYDKFNTIGSTATLTQLNTLFGSTGDKVGNTVTGTSSTVYYKWYPCPGKPKYVQAAFRSNVLYTVNTNFVKTICSGYVNDVSFAKLSLGMTYTAVSNALSSPGEKTKIIFYGGKTTSYYRFYDCYDSRNIISVTIQNDLVTSFSKNF